MTVESSLLLNWHVYIVRCSDGTLYTGVTIDVARRVEQHSSGKGAKYTMGRRPVELVFAIDGLDKRAAYREEYRIKHLTRAQKLELVSGHSQNK